MSTVTASDARSRLYRLIDEASDSHQPVTITGKRANAVLISEDDWTAIQETLYLVSIPGMRHSIISGMKTPVKNCGRKLNW
jgi:prevent-host-death family protein